MLNIIKDIIQMEDVMGFFSIDGKFFRALTKAGDFFILGILAIIFSIPVVTIGPTLTAVYYVALKLVRDEEGYVLRHGRVILNRHL